MYSCNLASLAAANCIRQIFRLFGTRSLIPSFTISARSTAYSLSLTHFSQLIYYQLVGRIICSRRLPPTIGQKIRCDMKGISLSHLIPVKSESHLPTAYVFIWH